MWASEIFIESILSDTNNILLEVWDNVLFVWKEKGRPQFLSKLNLNFDKDIYYRYEDYKQLSKKYHPDTTESKSSRVLSGDIQARINSNREHARSRDRRFIQRNFCQFFTQFNEALCIKDVSLRSTYARQLFCRLEQHSRMVFCGSLHRESSEFAYKLSNLFQQATKSNTERSKQYNKSEEAKDKTSTKRTKGSASRGQDFKNKLQELGREAQESLSNNRIRFWNKPGIKPESKKNNATLYGESIRANQIGLRRTYGNVFRMSVGGPFDISPLKT